MDSSVLFVSPYPEDARSLAQMLNEVPISLVYADSLKKAAGKLETENFGVVLTEAVLEDGSWLDVLELTRPLGTQIIVTDPWADAKFWATAINLGAYDLLAQPFRPTEVRRVLANFCCKPGAMKAGAAVS